MSADVVLINGNVITMDQSKPRAQAVAIKNGRITDVGSNSKIKRWIGRETKTIDLKGKTVVPGFIDTHAHMTAVGRSQVWINLRGVKSIKEIQRLLQKKVHETPKGKWIQGHGWDQERLREKRYPTRWDLDKVSPNNPAILSRICGHISVANTKALQLANINKQTVDPPAGKIDRDLNTGEPTGVLREKASDLVWNICSEPSKEELIQAASLACQKGVEAGLTSVHWFVDKPAEIRALQKIWKEGKLPLRVYIVVPVEYLDSLIDTGLSTSFGDHFLKLGCVKILADGSLGARTAALNQPYSDEPTTTGILCYSANELEQILVKAHEAGFQVAVHAIGDLAVDTVLNAFKKASKKSTDLKHRRHRIEHASVLNKPLIDRMRKLGLIACVQPHFIISDFWVGNRLGPSRARWTYPLKTLIKSGVPIAGGSDSPIEPINPLLGVYAAVARESFPEERISVEEALQMYTSNAAYASFEENIKGSIETGKLADLTVLSHNPLSVEPEKIRDIRVEMTIVGGKIVYSG